MEVILREDIEKLGNRGQVVKVASGYARNFLLPNRMAVAATDSNKKIVEQERQAHLRHDAKEQSDAADLGKMLESVSVTISQKAGENDQLFGSVTAKDIADSLEPLETIDGAPVHGVLYEGGLYEGVLYKGGGPEARALAMRLAKGAGPIKLFLTAAHDGHDPNRLLEECTISTNTAAAGGNASLMSIG